MKFFDLNLWKNGKTAANAVNIIMEPVIAKKAYFRNQTVRKMSSCELEAGQYTGTK